MDAKECRFCNHCDVNRINDFGQMRCTRFNTFVNLFDWCDYFISETSEKLFDAIKELKENANS